MSIPVPESDEEVLLVVHKHWAVFLPEALAVLVPTLLLVAAALLLPYSVVSYELHTAFTFLAAFFLFVGWVTVIIIWTTHYLDMLILTDRRLLYFTQVSLGTRVAHEWDIRDIHEVNVRIGGMLQSFLNYGTLEITKRSGPGYVAVTNIRKPEYVAAVILKQDNRYNELKETARKQKEFLRFMSHEIKGHLAKSKAAFAAIAEGDFGPISTPLKSMASSALADSQKGVDTVMSILQGADMERGTTTIEKKEFDFSAVVRRVVEDFRPEITEKKLELTSSIEDGCMVDGDAEKLERHVVRNLVENAFRYTPRGRIEVSLTKKDGMVHLAVTDTGVGITPQDMQRLFTEGGHGAQSKEVNPDSTGFGLYIAKQITEAHGGRISATSPGPAQGATFSADLPAIK